MEKVRQRKVKEMKCGGIWQRGVEAQGNIIKEY